VVATKNLPFNKNIIYISLYGQKTLKKNFAENLILVAFRNL